MQAIVRIPAVAALALAVPLFAAAQARNSAAPPATSHTETLIIAGHQEQAPLVRMNGRSYVDIESLARLTGASVRYNGNQIILTLPESSLGGRQGSGNGEQSRCSSAALGSLPRGGNRGPHRHSRVASIARQRRAE